ncbi:hypothetical protein [Snuella lapsa]|uniref:Fibronectin type-III domain-containing protein n=1 Tax=Snuella lapsa TaxID=870481 RepID=A0ABP6XB40_9FLAO
MRKLIYIGIVLLAVSCSSGGDSSEEKKASNPEKAVLVFPENNSECLEGQIINSQKSTVNFKWSKANSTDSYDISIKNLNDQTVKLHTTTNTSLNVEIDRGTPYSWYVVSKSKKSTTTAKSDTWKFYNAGEGVTEHAPFPAETVEPLNGAEVTASGGGITLKWSANDLDNNISSYTIYFGETTMPEIHQSDITSSQLDNVAVISGKIYYWKVKTTDEEGNTSMSDVFSFKVN